MLQEKTCFLPRMLNCLLLGHGRCVLHCGCRPPCETALSFATSALHRCMVGTRSMLSCLEACSQGDQATSTPGGSRGKSQKEPGGQQETEGARISYFGGRILARFLSFVAKSLRDSGPARNKRFLFSLNSIQHGGCSKEAEASTCFMQSNCDRDVQGQTCRNMTI